MFQCFTMVQHQHYRLLLIHSVGREVVLMNRPKAKPTKTEIMLKFICFIFKIVLSYTRIKMTSSKIISNEWTDSNR